MRFQTGFTLVELAIVITIIGLLIGGVLKGQELLDNARMTAVGTQVKSYQAAHTTFRDVYKGRPGDTNNATNFIQGCTAANNCVNGDNNGVIGTSNAYWWYGYAGQEGFQFWKHLQLAGLITGVDTTVALPSAYVGGRDLPKGPFGGMFYAKTGSGNLTTPEGAGNGMILYMTNAPAGDWTNTTAVVKSTVAMKTDMKLDDGRAFSGDVYGVSDGWISGCGYVANGTNGYNPNAAGVACDMGFTIGN